LTVYDGRQVMVTTAQPPRTLSAADRCDRCGAAAHVRVVLSIGGELLFCGHHARQHGPALQSKAARIDDQSERILAGSPDQSR